MDPLLIVGIACVVMLVLIYVFSLVLRGMRDERAKKLNNAGPVTIPAKKLAASPKRVVHEESNNNNNNNNNEDEEDDGGAGAANDGGHSARWNSFVHSKLNRIIGKSASALPGVGASYAESWRRAGCPSAISVVGTFLREGGGEKFLHIATEDVGMKAKYASDLQTALEERIQSLSLFGTSRSELQKQQKQQKQQQQQQEEADGHSMRWSVFVNAKLADLEMEDLPGVGEKYLREWKQKGYGRVSQVLGQMVFLGREQFEKYCEVEIGMRKVGKQDNVYELASALETKWNALLLLGN